MIRAEDIPDEVVETAARIYRTVPLYTTHDDAIRAAIAVVLEEAAKTVDQMPLSHPGNAAETALECAAAIRAMIPKEGV